MGKVTLFPLRRAEEKRTGPYAGLAAALYSPMEPAEPRPVSADDMKVSIAKACLLAGFEPWPWTAVQTDPTLPPGEVRLVTSTQVVRIVGLGEG